MEHIFTLESDNNQSASVYRVDKPSKLVFWGKIGASIFEIGSMEDLDNFIDLLQEIKIQTNRED